MVQTDQRSATVRSGTVGILYQICDTSTHWIPGSHTASITGKAKYIVEVDYFVILKLFFQFPNSKVKGINKLWVYSGYGSHMHNILWFCN